MARIRQKTLQFPGLNNTYTFADEADLFASGTVCKKGKYYIYNGDLYKCTTDHTGAWDATHFAAVKLGNELAAQSEAITEFTGNSEIQFIDGYYIKTSGTTVDITSTTASAERKYAVIDCQYGDKFTVTATGGANPRAWCFIDSSGNRLTVAGSGVNCNNTLITAPVNAAKLIINAKNDEKSYVGKILVNIVESLEPYNAKAIRLYTNNKAETTTNGITYSIANGVVSISGTATKNANITLEGSDTSIPQWITNGRYYVRLTKTEADNTSFQMVHYKTGESAAAFVSSPQSTYFTVTDISTYEGIVCRLRVYEGQTVNNTIKVEILSAIPNQDINIPIPSKIRIMQYNLGKFNMGQSLSGSYHFLTTENFETVLNNYKAMFGDIQPDVVGFEEYENNVTVLGTGGADDEDVSMDNLLFTPLFPYKGSGYGVISKATTFSKFAFINSSNTILTYTYTYDGTEYSDTFHVVYSHISVYGHDIATAVLAFPNSVDGYTDEQNLLYKEAHYQAVVDLLGSDKNAIIICDANAGPTTVPTIMEDVLTPAGYKSAHGSYFPWQATWESYQSGNTNAIDNIFYKGDIQLVNFKVLWDLKDNLASDHAPVYADFLVSN